MKTTSPRHRLTTHLINNHRLFNRPSPGKQFPDIDLSAGMIRLPALGLVWLFTTNHLTATPMVTITNDWAAAEVRLVAPRPTQGPPVYEWSDATQGAAEATLYLRQTDEHPTFGYYSGTAWARIGPTVNYNISPGYTRLFGSTLLADDFGACVAGAALNSIWNFTVVGDSAPFHVNALVDTGQSMDFTLLDCTTGQNIVSKSIDGGGFSHFGTLEPSHDYLLSLHQNAGGGDGQVLFAFGFSNPVLTEFASDRTHLPIPDSGTTLALLGISLGGLAALRHKFVRA